MKIIKPRKKCRIFYYVQITDFDVCTCHVSIKLIWKSLTFSRLRLKQITVFLLVFHEVRSFPVERFLGALCTFLNDIFKSSSDFSITLNKHCSTFLLPLQYFLWSLQTEHCCSEFYFSLRYFGVPFFLFPTNSILSILCISKLAKGVIRFKILCLDTFKLNQWTISRLNTFSTNHFYIFSW